MLKLRIPQRVLCAMVLTLFFGCHDDVSTLKPKHDQFTEGTSLSREALAKSLDAKELELPTTVDQPSEGRIEASVSTIGFDDEDVCLWTPDICSSGVATWPGYLELISDGNAWAYCWLSNGPNTGGIPADGDGGYYVTGYAFDADQQEAISVTGRQWFFYKMKRDNVTVNFDLTGIKVGGNHAITLYFKDSNNKWKYWSSLSPGSKNFGTHATNINEFHVSSASGKVSDYWTIDNIKVRPL